MRIKAYAKVNISLDIVGKREDGYHLLEMIMQSIDLYDELNIEKQNKENIPLSRLQQIFIRTEMWNENSIYTSMEEYRNINIPHGEYFNKKAKESRIVSDITKILSRYNLKIGSLSYEGLLPLDGKVIKEINKNIELNTSEAYLTGNLVLDIANQ